jgi:hypothetical protein
MGDPSDARGRAVERLKGSLLRRGSPRLQMVVFLTLTGLTGFGTSVLLHAAGMNTMAIRYPLSVAVAYLVFLFLLYLWLTSYRHRHARANSRPGSVYLDPWPYYYGSAPAEPSAAATGSPPAPADGGMGSGGGWGGLGDADAALVVIVLVILAIVAAATASVIILIEAPVLLAEVLVDGLLLAGLARRVRGQPSQHWMTGVVRRTWLPVVAVAAIFALVGLGLEQTLPGATTMGEALRAVQSP